MTIQQFIEAAIEGEWKLPPSMGPKPRFVIYKDSKLYGIYWIRWDTFPNNPMEGQMIRLTDMVLDPEAWKAVGKTKGWLEFLTKDRFEQMTVFIWNGVSLEEYIATL